MIYGSPYQGAWSFAHIAVNIDAFLLNSYFIPLTCYHSHTLRACPSCCMQAYSDTCLLIITAICYTIFFRGKLERRVPDEVWYLHLRFVCIRNTGRLCSLSFILFIVTISYLVGGWLFQWLVELTWHSICNNGLLSKQSRPYLEPSTVHITHFCTKNPVRILHCT